MPNPKERKMYGLKEYLNKGLTLLFAFAFCDPSLLKFGMAVC